MKRLQFTIYVFVGVDGNYKVLPAMDLNVTVESVRSRSSSSSEDYGL